MPGYRMILNLSSAYSEDSSNKSTCDSQDDVEAAAILVSRYSSSYY